MAKIYADIDISLDGFIAGPNISQDAPLGEGGEKLIWYGDDVNDLTTDFNTAYQKADALILEESAKNEGAVIMGRNTFDLSIDSWGNDPPIHKPCFVVTSRPRPELILGDTSFTFILTGLENVIRLAIVAAGGKDVCVMGGAHTIAECINSELLDELHLHIIPVLLGKGLDLFGLIRTNEVAFEKVRVTEGATATHILLKVGSTR